MTASVVTLCSIERRQHLERQIAGVGRWMPHWEHLSVLIGAEPFEVPGSRVLDLTGPGPVNLAAARNAAGDAAVRAGAEAIVFLDADCIPGPGLGAGYLRALGREPGGVHAGPVTYLSQGAAPGLDELAEHTAPHRARPDPPAGELQAASADEFRLFWSLSFAVGARTWVGLRDRFGGFCEEFSGYGGEDTDFGMSLQRSSIGLWWVGGAHAYHQWHPVSAPPVEHLAEILLNAETFHRRWGWWPMEGWLTQFERLGLARFDGQRWVQTGQ